MMGLVKRLQHESIGKYAAKGTGMNNNNIVAKNKTHRAHCSMTIRFAYVTYVIKDANTITIKKKSVGL